MSEIAVSDTISGILPKMLTVTEVSTLVNEELTRISDPLLAARMRELLVIPYPVERDWHYGHIGEKFTCWTVLEDQPSKTGIAYCQQGFGPSEPWGLVHLSGEDLGIGMDSAWFSTLESAMRQSPAWDGSNPANYEIP